MSEDNRKKAFGRIARAARERAGFAKRPAFARATGLSVRTVAAVELGEDGAGGRESRAVFAATLGWDPVDVEDYIDGRVDELPPLPEPSSTAALDMEDVLTMSRETLVKVARMVERVSGSDAAEKFLFDALALRQRQQRDIKPPSGNERDAS